MYEEDVADDEDGDGNQGFGPQICGVGRLTGDTEG